jgi:hypothetical protein
MTMGTTHASTICPYASRRSGAGLLWKSDMPNLCDFDRFVYQTLADPKHSVFLILTMDKKDVVGGQIALRVTNHLLENCVPGLTFDLFKQHMNENTIKWDLIVVAIGNNGDGSAPAVDQCSALLEDMERRVNSGALEGFVIFDQTDQSGVVDGFHA